MIKNFFIAMLFFITQQNSASEMIITQPGIYRLSGSVAISPTGPATLITVLSSDVVLDLNGYRLEQLNSTPGVNGIIVGSDFTNLALKNGIIAGFTQSGLTVNQGCSIIRVESLIFERCATSAALFLGLGSNPIAGLELVDCQSISCSQSAAASTTMSVNNCDGVMISNLSILGMSNPNNLTLTLLLLDSCVGVVCDTVTIFNNSLASGLLRGISLINASGSDFINLRIERNSVSTGNLEGIRVEAAVSISLSSCSIIQNTASQSVHGLICEGCFEDLYDRCCVIANQSGSTLAGVRISDLGGTPSFGQLFLNSSVSGNSATNECQGFFIDDSREGTLKNCVITNNTAGTVSSIGLFFSTVSTSSWTVADCVIDSNTGPGSLGVSDTGGAASANFYTKNTGFNNGAIAANQFSNVPPGSQTTSTTGNLNTNTLPWTNIAVVT